jgi:para-nitrobenzyl esterase
LSIREILDAQDQAFAGGMAGLPRGTIDGTTFTDNPSQTILSGEFNRVPVIDGTNHNEGQFFTYTNPNAPVTDDDYETLVQGMFGPMAGSILAEYPAANYVSPLEAYSAFFGDFLINWPNRKFTHMLSAQGVSVYAYEFMDPNTPNVLPVPVPLGPTHGNEVAYVFQDTVPFVDPSMFTEEKLALSDEIISYWANFAWDGNPTPLSGEWTVYNNETDLFFGLTSEPPGSHNISTFAADHHCDFWDAHLGP